MAIVEMTKTSIIGLNKDKEQILESLMKMGVVELLDIGDKLSSGEWSAIISRDGDSESVSDLESDLQKLKFAIDTLSQFDTRKKSLLEFKRTVTENELNSLKEDQARLELIVDKVVHYDEQLTGLKAERNRTTNLMASLEPWKPLSVPLETAFTVSTTVVTGVISAAMDPEEMKQQLEEQVAESYIQVVNRDQEQSYLLLIYYSASEDAVQRLLKKYGFSRVSFKELEGTAEKNIRKASEAVAEIDIQCKEIGTALADLAEGKNDLEVLYDYLTFQQDRKKALVHLGKTDKVFMLEGWVPERLSAQVREALVKNWDCIADIRKPGSDEEYPVLLSNNDLGQAVESITQMYSLPHYKEIDPNVIMAPFFILFFGLMLSDGGYGLLMAATSTYMLWRFPLTDEMKRIMKLMLYCGFSTILWGALFGSWFGIAALGEYPLWFNPMEDPEEMLRWVLAFGVIHIYIGIGVRGVNLFRGKKYMDILFDVVLWYVFFTGFVLFALPYVPKMDNADLSGLVATGRTMLIVGAILLILTQGRQHKNIIIKLLSGMSRLYDLIAFMSDVLSYSRLLALGLATSVIASIVNQLSAMNGLDNIFKIIGFILILLIGHSFNFAINALGAFVHSIRLQYIEFFGKFYRGGGTPFKPLKINTKYVNFKH